MNLGAPAVLLRNTSPGAGHWIGVQPGGEEEQSRRNRRAGRSISRRGAAAARADRGFRLPVARRRQGAFRVGKAATIGKLTVTWPSGTVQTLDNVAVDRVVTVEEK